MPERKDQPEERDVVKPELTEMEEREAGKRSALRAQVVYEAIRREGNDELRRSTAALAWPARA